jgi:hypothetical protein
MEDKRGVESLYLVLEAIRQELESNSFVNTVTFGNILELDLSKTTIYPLAHLTLNNITHSYNNLQFNFTLYNLDIVNISKEESEDKFYGNDNTVYILTNQLQVINRLMTKLSHNKLNTSWELNGEPLSDTVYKEKENMLAGYETTFTVDLPNDIDTCS